MKMTEQLEALLAEMREESSTGRHWADKLEEVVFAAAPEPAGWAEVVVDRPPPLVLAPAEPQPDAPTDIAQLPAYWDERRAKQGKPDKSRCAAELRIALNLLSEHTRELAASYNDGFARGVEYGRALAQLGKP